jgi:CRISPR-associated protein Csm2
MNKHNNKPYNQTKKDGLPNKYGTSNQYGKSRRDNQPIDEIFDQMKGQLETTSQMKDWKVSDITKYGESLGEKLAKGRVSTSQIRRFIDELQRISQVTDDQEKLDDIYYMKVNLAYSVGRIEKRNEKDLLREFEKCVSFCIDRVKNIDDVKNFKRFVESVVAYHRYHGGN